MDKFKFLGVNFRKCMAPPLRFQERSRLEFRQLEYYYYPTNDCYFIHGFNKQIYKITSITPILLPNGSIRFRVDGVGINNFDKMSIKNYGLDYIYYKRSTFVTKKKYEDYKLLS